MDIKDQLKTVLHCSAIIRRRGMGPNCYRACYSYFYRVQAPKNPIEKIIKRLPKAVILEEGDHWHIFVGSAAPGSSQDSFIWVDFRINPMDIPEIPLEEGL